MLNSRPAIDVTVHLHLRVCCRPYLTQQQLAHRVIELCASLKSPVSLADPIYAPNNLARGLKPEVLVGYAKTALADWPRSFLQRMDLPTGA
jgi:hypothetical protein